MEHEERIEVAKFICEKIRKKYGKNIIAGGIYGSTAKGKDTENSDIDIVFIVKDSQKNFEQGFLYRGIEISYWSIRCKDALNSIRNVDFGWPWRLSALLEMKILIGDKKIKNKFGKELKKLKFADFKRAVQMQLPNIYEYYFKIQKNLKMKDIRELLFCAGDWMGSIVGCVALLNRKYFLRNNYYRFQESYAYKLKPKNYDVLVDRLCVSKRKKEIKKLVDELWKSFLEFLNSFNIKIKEYSSLSEMEVQRYGC